MYFNYFVEDLDSWSLVWIRCSLVVSSSDCQYKLFNDYYSIPASSNRNLRDRRRINIAKLAFHIRRRKKTYVISVERMQELFIFLSANCSKKCLIKYRILFSFLKKNLLNCNSFQPCYWDPLSCCRESLVGRAVHIERRKNFHILCREDARTFNSLSINCSKYVLKNAGYCSRL